MSEPDAKLRFVAERQLAHVDPMILRQLLTRPEPQSPAAVSALVKAMLIQTLDSYPTDDSDQSPKEWSARIKASLPEDGGEGFFFVDGRQAEASVPAALKDEFESDVSRAVDELHRYRSMSRHELDKAYSAACADQVRATDIFREADWDVWLALPVWRVEETAALLFGKDPADLHPAAKGLPDWARSAFAEKLVHLKRHVEAGTFKGALTPKAVREWAVAHDVDAPARLLVNLEAVVDQVDTQSGDSLHHHTRKLFYHSLLYLAVIHHGYDPVAVVKGRVAKVPVKSRAPKQISDALKAAGFEGSDKAIRNHLGDAVEAYKSEYGYAALEKLAALRKLPNDKV